LKGQVTRKLGSGAQKYKFALFLNAKNAFDCLRRQLLLKIPFLIRFVSYKKMIVLKKAAVPSNLVIQFVHL